MAGVSISNIRLNLNVQLQAETCCWLPPMLSKTVTAVAITLCQRVQLSERVRLPFWTITRFITIKYHLPYLLQLLTMKPPHPTHFTLIIIDNRIYSQTRLLNPLRGRAPPYYLRLKPNLLPIRMHRSMSH